METPITTPPIIDQIKQYLETKIKLLKLEGIDKTSAIVAGILTDMIMAVLIVLAFILMSITAALFAGQLLHSYWEGFACVTAFYLIMVLVARLLRISLQNLFVRLIIQKVFINN